MKYKLKEKLDGFDTKPHASFIEAFDSGNFPFANHEIIGYEPGLLSFEEFERCVSWCKEKVARGNSLNGDMYTYNALQCWMAEKERITEAEAPVKESLETIAKETIREIFNVPDDILLKSKIESNISSDLDEWEEDESIKKNMTAEQLQNLDCEIKKRILLNSLCHGAAIHIWKTAYYIVDVKIKDLNEELISRYDYYSALTSYLLWTFDISTMVDMIKSNNQISQGMESVDIEKKEIQALAINFPVLLHELTKGVIEYLISKGIPQDFTEDELRYYYSQADKYEDEVWHYYIGPSLWVKLIEALNVNTQELPEKISIISQMNYNNLVDLFIPIIDGDDEKIKIKLKLYGLK